MGSCEEALLPGDAGEARVCAGAPAAAVAAGSERTVPALWAGPGDAVTPSEEATDTPPRRRLGLAGQVGGRHGCHGANTCLRTHCRGVDSALLQSLSHGKKPAEFRSNNNRSWSSSKQFPPPKRIFAFRSCKMRVFCDSKMDQFFFK